MYQVLLVDDEPFMLSGIKRLIDWEKNGCVLAGTASGGMEALEKMEKLRPDIVVSDIVMPGLTGLELLKRADAEFPGTVFILLTNHEEFSLVREALRYHIVEYLVKNNLESKTLEESLARAVAEREKRKKLHRVKEADELLCARQHQEQIRNAIARFLQNSKVLPPEDIALLVNEGMLSRFAFAFIPLNFAVVPEYPEIPDNEQRKIIEWEMEIAERLAATFFPRSLLFAHSGSGASSGASGGNNLLLFAWDLPPDAWESGIAQFRERFIKTSAQITRLGADVLASGVYETADSPESPSAALSRMAEEYHTARRGIHSDLVKKARQYILDNVEKRIMLQDVAEYVCISPGYLSTLFKKEYNQNLVGFINQAKIDRACELLRKNRYRINEISYMLGFENAFYFTRVFHRHIGLTPSEFQARSINNEGNIVNNNNNGGGGGG